MFINLNSNEYPVSAEDIRQQQYPSSLPDELSDEILSELGYAIVQPVSRPQVKMYQMVEELLPHQIGGVWTQRWNVITPPLETCKQYVLSKINAEANERLSVVKYGYPQGEVESWAKQEAEAKAYLADSSAAVPLIAAIAAARGLPLSDLANRIMLKSNAYAEAVGTIIGLRQALETDLEDADEETIDLVEWPD